MTEPESFLKSIDTIGYERAVYALEEKVMEIVNQYDSAFKNNPATEPWYRQFWSSLRGGNIFTLNYDSTIEESLVSYEDGFEKHWDEEYCRFSAGKNFKNADKKTTIAHLHGSILYSEPKSFPNEKKYSHRATLARTAISSAGCWKGSLKSSSCRRRRMGSIQLRWIIISRCRIRFVRTLSQKSIGAGSTTSIPLATPCHIYGKRLFHISVPAR